MDIVRKTKRSVKDLRGREGTPGIEISRQTSGGACKVGRAGGVEAGKRVTCKDVAEGLASREGG